MEGKRAGGVAGMGLGGGDGVGEGRGSINNNKCPQTEEQLQ